MSEGKSEKEQNTLQTPIKKRLIDSGTSIQVKSKQEPAEQKRSEEFNEPSSDSNKSNNIIQTPNVQSSANKEYEYQTPMSRYNVSLIFSGSNGKMTQTQRRIMNHNK